MMSVLGARARCSGEIRRSVLALVLDKIEVLSARFFKVLEHRARTEHWVITFRALKCLYKSVYIF